MTKKIEPATDMPERIDPTVAPATDEQIDHIESVANNFGYTFATTNDILSLIARIRSIREETIRECAAAYEAHDKVGREWIATSLWGSLNNEGAARVLSLLDNPAAERSAWQPIDTAPKDGTWFIGVRGNQAFSTQASYGNIWIPNGKGGHIPDPNRKTFSWLASEMDRLMPWEPTHWTPLPTPPAASKGEGR